MEKILKKEDVRAFLAGLQNGFGLAGPTRKGAGPTRKGGITSYNYLSFAPVENLNDLVLRYHTTVVSPKMLFLPDREVLFSFKRENGEVVIEDARKRPEKHALIGVHPCDLTTLKRLERVFTEFYRDPYYQEARANTIIVGFTCNEPAASCFCEDVGSGPDADEGYDLLSTDLGDSYFVKVGTKAGEKLVADQHFKDAGAADAGRREEAMAKLRERLRHRVAMEGLRNRMAESYGEEVWDDFSQKCAACGTCNMVCPTCHCFTVLDKTNMDETEGKRIRVWDSCHFERFAKMGRS